MKTTRQIEAVRIELQSVRSERSTAPGTVGALMVQNLQRTIRELSAKL